MKKGPDGLPAIGRSARTLGVRVEGKYADVTLDAAGRVLPAKGGMSVTVDEPKLMPPARRPTWLKGAGEDPLFFINKEKIVSPLTIRLDKGAHAFVEPTLPRPLFDYENDLARTQPDWMEIEP